MRPIRRSIGTNAGRHFDSMKDYLAPLIPRPQGATYKRWLTMVITKNNESSFPRVAQRLKERAETPSVPAGFPWITPVLGSGSVEVRLLEGGAPLQRRLAAIEASHRPDGPGDGRSEGEVAAKFARSLLVDRLGRSLAAQLGGPTPAVEPTPDSERLTALLVVTGMLTRLHHRAMDEHEVPMSRWDDPELSAIPEDWELSVEGAPFLLPLVNRLLGELIPAFLPGEDGADSSEDPHSVVDAAVGTLLEQCKTELERRALICRSNLRLLTECAWYFLVEDCLTYPGWSDLMLDLALQQDPIAHQHGWPMPLYGNIGEPEEEIRIQYQKVAKNSWNDRRASRQRSSLHDRVARCLVLQAGLRSRNRGPQALPMASAFVTSFDLELELALMDAKQRFVLALPVFVGVTKSGEVAESEELAICWIGCVIEPMDAPGCEGHPTIFNPARWFMLSGFGGFGKTEKAYRDLPVVVRLTGCPAIAPPTLDGEDHEGLRGQLCELVGIEPGEGEVMLHPAFVMDEYVAGAMAATDTFLDHLELARLGLPQWIAGAPGGANAQFARFWLVLGVQLGDSSIRQRVVAQLTAPRLVAASLKNPPAITGLVLNRRIGPLDGWLMRWQGFDIVSDRAAKIGEHLEHYASHLAEVEKVCDPASRCTVGKDAG